MYEKNKSILFIIIVFNICTLCTNVSQCQEFIQSSFEGGGMGYSMIGWSTIDIDALNSRLKKNGYVLAKKMDHPTENTGRPRIYYTLTPHGLKKLADVQRVNKTLWIGIPDLDEFSE